MGPSQTGKNIFQIPWPLHKLKIHTKCALEDYGGMADGQLVCDGGRERSEMLYLCTIHYSRVIYQTPACVGASAVLCGGHQRWIRSGSWATRMRHSPVCVCGACVCVCHVCSVAQSCPTLCDLMDCSPSGSSVHGSL